MHTSLDIERVVREVLAALTSASAPAPTAPAPTAADGQVVLCGRTISLADLPDRWEGVRRVVVATAAVVTPSVRDELARRAVSLVRADPQSTATERPPVLVVSMDSPLDSGLVVQALQGEGYAVQSRHGECLIRAADELAKEVAGRRSLGVLLTRHAAAAVCLANRLAGVRAIRGSTPEAIAADASAVGANVLVVDTSAAGFFAVRQAVGRFLHGGVRQCPKVFQKQLA
jgi:hypothetical protein